MKCFEKLKEKSSKERFYSSWVGNKISNKKYKHVIKVCNISEMENMKHCGNLYLKCFVLLLADVFEKFRNNTLKNYKS